MLSRPCSSQGNVAPMRDSATQAGPQERQRACACGTEECSCTLLCMCTSCHREWQRTVGSTAGAPSAAGTGLGAAGRARGAAGARARPETRQCTLEPPKPKLEMATVPPCQGVAPATTCRGDGA